MRDQAARAVRRRTLVDDDEIMRWLRITIYKLLTNILSVLLVSSFVSYKFQANASRHAGFTELFTPESATKDGPSVADPLETLNLVLLDRSGGTGAPQSETHRLVKN